MLETITQSSVTETAIAITATIGGAVFAMQRLVKIWGGTKTDIATTASHSDLLDTLRDENKSIRDSERSAREELNNAMRELGRLEMMEVRVIELKAEIQKMEVRYSNQEIMLTELSVQNARLLLKLERCAHLLGMDKI